MNFDRASHAKLRGCKHELDLVLQVMECAMSVHELGRTLFCCK